MKFIIALIMAFSLTSVIAKEAAYCIVPVVDLVGDALAKKYSTESVAQLYNNLPLFSKNIADCLRVHQLLFNERVTILEQKGDEVLIQIASVYFESEKNDEKNDTYWALKKNFITISALESLGMKVEQFPDYIDYNYPQKQASKPTVVLIEPFYDDVTKQYFSVGTRFALAKNKNNRTNYCAYVFNNKTNALASVCIPRHLCLDESKRITNNKKIETYVALLKRWAHTTGIIPYVWGGCSFTTTCKNNTFTLQHSNDLQKKLFYRRPELKESPKTGFDCTGLMVRAAQIAGLPYFFKNSTTIKKNLQALNNNDSIAEGDVLWIPGHVMIVSDIVNNKLIEARAYNAGFGKVHEVSLAEVFKGINSYSQLKDIFHQKKQLERLDSKGKSIQIIDEFKILKLSSLWQK